MLFSRRRVFSGPQKNVFAGKTLLLGGKTMLPFEEIFYLSEESVTFGWLWLFVLENE